MWKALVGCIRGVFHGYTFDLLPLEYTANSEFKAVSKRGPNRVGEPL